MILKTPTLEQCERVRLWRNAPDVLPTLRTKEPLTVEQQAAFYRDVICNPASNHRYYALWATRLAHPLDENRLRRDVFVGLGGLTYLDRVPGEGEISLILDPAVRGSGLGAQAVQLLRAEGARLGLQWIIGECYDANPSQMFWVKEVSRCDGRIRFYPDRMCFRMSVIATEDPWGAR
jgi:RimJ/RimL family protein N-acetyltransferase